ncbi:hypothetical protein KL920_004570 [Ogataea angusta]|nr:hypothetical protein KL920_004570 [Ogataea angusta]
MMRLLNSIQPPPGMTRQQRLEQMIQTGELKDEDILLLKRHQQMIKQQQAQLQAAQAAGQLTPQQQQQLVQKKLAQQQQQQQQQPGQRNFLGLTQEQLAKLNPQQRKMLMIQQLRRRAKTQRFYESSEEILKKFENYPASLEFHIHENHYRFGNQDAIIPKSSPTVKEFLEYVAKGEIPEPLVEVIKDGGVQLYDGSLILKVYDHRNLIPVKQEKQEPGDGKPDAPETKAKPKEYRTVLRFTQLAQYDDLSYQADTQQFHDTFALTFESEVLTATNRNINLQPIVNPYHYDKSLRPYDMVAPEYDPETDQMRFVHRADAREVDQDGQKTSLYPLSYTNYPYKPLHEDLPHTNSKYEQLMTILSESYTHNNRLSESAKTNTNEPGQFQRLRFVEMWRHKVELIKQAAISGGMNPNASDPSMNGLLGGMTQQQRALINQERMLNQRQKEQMASAVAAAGHPHAVKPADSRQGSTPVPNMNGSFMARGVSTPVPHSMPGSMPGSASAGAEMTPARDKKGAKKIRKPAKRQATAGPVSSPSPSLYQQIPGAYSPMDEPARKRRMPYKQQPDSGTPS